MIRVGLIGARGYVGREFIRELDKDGRFELTFASSRAMQGRKLSATPGLQNLTRFGELVATAVGPDDVRAAQVDVIVLGLPNGMAAPYVEAIERSQSGPLLIDLSADYRHKDGWVYGALETNRERLKNARRIANPGCYATAGNLGLWPLKDWVAGPVSMFGLSGFSGAGTNPGQKNDPERLEANVLPYGFGGHGHESEVSAFTGLDLIFMPHVAGFFRGLLVSLSVPLNRSVHEDEVADLFSQAYANEDAVEIADELPEIASVAGRDVCSIGGFTTSQNGRVLTYSSALDNLRKGAATQALDNIVTALL